MTRHLRLAVASSLLALALSPFDVTAQAPAVTATKDDGVAAATKIPEGTTVNYTNTISNSAGAGTATGVTFSDPDIGNASMVANSVNVSPLARDDTYATVGNTLLEVGVAASGSPAIRVTAAGTDSLFDNDSEYLGDTFTLKSVEGVNFVAGSVTAPTEQGGSVTVTAAGNFTYTPPAGFSGTDNFDYVITDDGAVGSAALTGSGRVTITVDAQRVWYVKNDAPAGGLGRSGDPFDTLAEAEAASAANDTIYVYAGAGDTTGQSTGITLKSGQRLLGEGVALTVPVGLNGDSSPTTLRSAGSRPRVHHTAGNGVSATNVVPAEIAGLSLSGSANAVDVTITTGVAGTLAIHDNIIFGAGAEGIDINKDGNATLTLNVTNNSWNIAGTHTGNGFDLTKGSSGNPGFVRLAFSGNSVMSAATAVSLDGSSSGGQITVLGFGSNSIHQNTGGSGLTASSVVFDSDVGTAGFQTVSAGTTVIGVSGNGVGGSGMVLTNVSGDLAFTDLDIVADGGAALSAGGTGAANPAAGTGFRLTTGAGVCVFSATGGPAVNVSNATLDIQSATIFSTNSSTTGVSLASVNNGTTSAVFSAGPSSSILNATGTDFSISSSNASVAYGGTITDDVGQLVSISSCNGGTKTFNGAITDGDDGDGSGVSLSNNTGTTIAFTGGLVLSTGSNAAFAATGGGTVSVTGSANKLTTTTGTPLNVANTTIAAAGLTFRSIAANGAASGIILSNTGSGGLTVTGTGGAGSGGTIQNVSGDGIQLTSAQNISLTDMAINTAGGSWLDATTVTNLTLVRVSADLSTDHGFKASGLTNLSITGGTFDRGGAGNGSANFNGFDITNLLGTSTVSGSTFRRSNTIQFRVNNNTATSYAGTPDTLTVTGTDWNTHNNAFAGDHLSVNADTGANFRLVVNSSAGINKVNEGGSAATGGGIGVQATAGGTNGKMDASITGLKTTNNTAGVVIAQTGGGAITYNIFGNNTANGTGFSSTGSGAIFVTHASSGGTSSGTISNNSINHTAGPGTNAMQVVVEGSSGAGTGGTGTVLISQNSITGNFQRGIQLQARVATSTLNATVTNNTLVGTDTTNTALQVVNIETGASGSGHACTMRLNLANNSATFPGATYIAAYRLINRSGCTFQLQDFAGVGSSTTDVSNWVTTTKANTGTPVAVTATAAYAATAGSVPAPLMFVPQDEAALPAPQPVQSAAAQPQATRVQLPGATSPALPPAAPQNTAASVVDAPAGPSAARPAALTQAELDAVVRAALARWETTGLSDEQKARLRALAFKVADLPGWYLGEADGDVIRIDADAGGNGWFVDATPMEDSEFTGSGSRLVAAAADAGAPAGHVDLLTTVMHEMGHGLGLCDGYSTFQRRSVMHGFLTKGERRVPQQGEAMAAAPHAHAKPRHLSSDITIGDLPPGKSVTIVYAVTVNSALTWTGAQLSSQGQVSGSNFTTVNGVSTSEPNTDDPNAAGAANPTVTLLDRPDTTVVSLLRTSPSPTKEGIVDWQIVFSQAVSNLSTSNFALVQGGSGPVSGATIQSVGPPGATPSTTWNITVESGTGDGTLGLNLANDTGLTHDVVSSLPSVGEVYTIDKTAPSTTSFTRQTPASSPTNADSLVFRATFSENVEDVGPSDFTVTGTTAGVTGVATVSASSYDITVSGGDLASLDGTVGLNFNAAAAADFITDAALNNLPKTEPATDQTYTLDNTAPTVAMSSAMGNPTVNATIPVTVTFSESVTGFAAGDIVPVNATVTNFAGSGTTYTFDLTPNGPGVTVTADIASGVAQDAAGNNNTAATQFSRTIVDQVSVATANAGDNDAAETGGNLGTYTFTRGSTAGSLVVNFQLDPSSTATAGTDFTLSGATSFNTGTGAGSVTFADTVATVTVTLTAVAEAAVGGGQAAEGAETVRLNVVPQAGVYVAGTPADATVTIAANGFVVVNTNDSGSGSLRQAVQNANDIAGDDVITFAGTVFTDATVPDVISLTSGQLVINSNASITGPGANVLTVQNGAGAGADNRVFRIESTFTSTLRGLTISGGNAGTSGGIDVVGGGTPTSLTLLYCTVSGNTAGSYAGGIGAGPNSILNVISSTISGNTAGTSNGTGGAIDFNGSALQVINSTISGNSTPNGDNNGGGIWANAGTVTIINSTITNNQAAGASSAGGVRAHAGSTVTVGNSIIAGNQNNSTVPDVINAGTLTSSGGNVVGNAGAFAGFNQTGDVAGTGASPVDAALGALSLGNGGTTATHALLAGSPALNTGVAGNLPTDVFDTDGDSDFGEALPVDQRGAGFDRSIGAPDAGAYELQKSVSIIADAPSANEGSSGTTNFTFTVTRTGSTTGAVNMTYSVGGAAVNGTDFVGGTLPTGTATIADGSSTATVTIPVNGDTTREANEDFTVTLSSPDNGYVVAGIPATSTITNDDFEANLAITVTDGVTTATPGGSVTYTITASNAGPDPVVGATVADTFPAVLTATWTAVGAGGGTATASGSGNINDTVNLPVGASVTYTVTASISASATGTLSNTATVAVPAGMSDPTPANNSATDTDTLTPQADLAIIVTDGVATAVPGGSTTYTITVSNAGPSNAPGVTVADTFPASLTATWTAVGAGGGTATASGSGNINDTVNLPAGGSVTYTVSASISAAATGTLVNMATVAAPGGVTDSNLGNNSATDSDTLTPQADLSITVTDAVTTAVPGGSTTYTITVSNAGPSNAPGATVADTFPASLTTTWTAVGAGGGTATASGSGNINDTVNLPAGGSVTYTVSASISAAATGTLSNTATVAAPGGVTDSNPANNSATDSDTLTPQADLAITVTDGVTTAVPGSSVTYTITVSNAGPSNAPGATVADTFPASLTTTWTAVGAGGGTATASGSGNINDTVNLPAGGSVTYTVSAAIANTAFGTLSNTATVSAPGGITDPTAGNNSATDTDTLSTVVSIAATDAAADENAAGTGTWRVTRNGTSGSVTVQLEIDASSTAASADWSQSGATFGSLAPGSAGTVVIPDGSGFADITLTPLADIHAEAAESVKLNITADASYTAINPTTATVTIGANDFVVINANDSGEGSLRQAVENANTLAGDDVVTFSTPQAVVLTSGELVAQANGTLTVAGGGTSSISGGNSSRVFNVNSGATLKLTGLLIKDGNPAADGGAIYNAGMLDVISSTLSNNAATGVGSSGGAIFNNSGAVGLVNSTVSASMANGSGGAVYNSSGILSVVNSTISGNVANADGGGLFNDNGTLIVDSATVTANAASTGGGVRSTGGSVTLYNSIIAANSANTSAPDLSSAAVATAANNLIGVDTGHTVADGVSGNLVGTAASPLDALLGALADNGGPTQTHMLQDGSPAINAGDNGSLSADVFDLDGDSDTAEDLPVDQRGIGFARIIGATVDIGAYEAFAFRPAITAATTNEDVQSASGLVVTPNTADGGLTTHFKITNIQNGTLYKSDGTTVITAGTFLTLTEGAAGLKFTPSLNLNSGNTATFGFDAQATVDGADTGLRTGIASAAITVTPVNDAPTVVAPGLADQSMTVGDNRSVALAASFTDVDGDTLTYSVQTNSDNTKASAAINGTNVDLVALTYGVTNITIQASDGNTGTVTDTFQVAVGTVNPTPGPVPPPPGPGGYPVTAQTGMYDIVIPVTNTTAFPINGFRLAVDFSAYLAAFPSLRLYDSSSAPGVTPPFVDHPFPVAVGSTVNVKLSFYTSTRTFPNPFNPTLTVTTLPVSQVGGAAGPGVAADIRRNSGGEILLEWASTAGAWYRVQYSDDLVTWFISSVPVQASANRTQWIDSGAPFTQTPPGASRFYRVNEIPTPTP